MTEVDDWLRLTDAQRSVLATLHAIFLRDGDWPFHVYLEQVLERDGIELNDELASLPARLFAPDRRNPGGPGYYQETDEMKLLLPGLAALDRASEEVRMFVAVLQWAVDQRRSVVLGPRDAPDLRWSAADAIAAMKPVTGEFINAARAKLVLDVMREEMHVPVWAGVWARFPEWTLSIPREIRQYRRVETIDDFLALTIPQIARPAGDESPSGRAEHPPLVDRTPSRPMPAAEVSSDDRGEGDVRGARAAQATKAFISYAHEDSEFVDALVQQLLAHRLDVRYDKVTLRVGDSMIQRIADAIAEGDFLIAVVSPDSVESEWCRRELSLAQTAGINERRVKVLPVRIRSAEIPATLSDAFWADGDRVDVEALASQLADSMASHRSDATHTSSEPPAQAREARSSTGGADGVDAVVERALDVLAEWSRCGSAEPTTELQEAQRRLRFVLDTLPPDVVRALPIASSLANEAWEPFFSSRRVDDVEGDLREEFRAIRAQIAQDVPLVSRWSIDEGPDRVSAGDRDAIAFRWVIARGDDRRVVRVFISRTVEASANEVLPEEVAAAKTSRGRTVATMIIALDDPPDSAMVTSSGITWPVV